MQANEGTGNRVGPNSDMSMITPSNDETVVTSPVNEPPCPTCGSGSSSIPVSYVYAVGDDLEPRIPNLGLEKEIRQVISQKDMGGKTDRQTFDEVLSNPENRYLAYEMCWVFRIHGQETYILKARSQESFNRLLEAYSYGIAHKHCYYLIVGIRGPIAPPEFCNGLMIPVVAFDQIYFFTRDELIKAIPKPENTNPEQFEQAAEEVFDSLILMTDNAGTTNAQRALNYSAVRVAEVYGKVKEEFDQNSSLKGVDVYPVEPYSPRDLQDVVFTFESRTNGVIQKHFIRIDTTDKYLFQVKPLSRFFDR